MTARFAVVIPARYASQRFPGKPLAKLRGSTGEERTLIHRSWSAGVSAAGSDCVWVATDDERIAQEVARFGGASIMTPSECRNGTERCAAALAELDEQFSIIVNLQGDAPLTPTSVIAELVEALVSDPDAAVATPAVCCSPSMYRHLVVDQENGRVGGTTVVFGQEKQALYFSKQVIPHVPDRDGGHAQVHLHLGVYAYRPAALRRYAAWPPSPLELTEGLEQLRFLENGDRIKMVPIAPPAWDCIELNNPQDVVQIEAIMAEQGMV